MIIKYCTKRDINGNTYKIEIDTDKKTFTREPAGFFHRADCVQVSKKDYREIIKNFKNSGYTEI